MYFFTAILLFCFLVFLFVLYLLGREDFVLIRKDITLEKLFNLAFVQAGVALFFSRFFYGVFFSKSIFANPFTFLLFPYFPGLSLLGGILGGLFFLFLRKGKGESLPALRLFDFFSAALLSVLPIGFLGYFLLSGDKLLSLRVIFILVSYIILNIVFVMFAASKLTAGKFRDGTLGLLFLISYSLVSLISNALKEFNGFMFFADLQNETLIVILFASLISIFREKEVLKEINKLIKRFW